MIRFNLNIGQIIKANPSSGDDDGDKKAKQAGNDDRAAILARKKAKSNGTSIEHDGAQLTPEQRQAREAAHQAEHDDVAAMKKAAPLPEGNETSKSKGYALEANSFPELQYSSVHGLKEAKHLKDISQMSDDEIVQELNGYGVDAKVEEGTSTQVALRTLLLEVRNERARTDINSDEVDGHIGTYVQGAQNAFCSLLSQLDTMTDAQIQDMIETKTNDNGEKVYSITFPIDKGTARSVEVSESELKSGRITVLHEGQEETTNSFPTGDEDVTLICMAYVKRFGGDIITHGAWQYDTQNAFRTLQETELKDNQHLEDMDLKTLGEHNTIAILSLEEIARKGVELEQITPEALEGFPANIIAYAGREGILSEVSDGRKAYICDQGIFLSDGTTLSPGHAMSIRGYDDATGELVISGSEFNNMSEIRIPGELSRYLEAASTAETPGVANTPEPDNVGYVHRDDVQK